jgi:GalNAc-alpha-(1->4)-GalNAc-alpha-(1->3)-diNAcBac-PP-undecaprenol alpha-1,4-N-acetyl-D-galactosaminyltransferase
MGMLTRSNPAESTDKAGDGAAPRRKRVALVIFHMGPGGAQRVVANAVGPLLDRGIELHLLLFTERGDAYPIDPRVKVHVWLPLASGAPALNDEDGDASPPQASNSTAKRSGKSGLHAVKRLVPNSAAFAYELVRISAWIRRTLRGIEPDAVLSFLTQTNILTVVATRGLDTRTVISERNDPKLQRHRPRVELLRRIVYPWADVVTANSKGALETLGAFVPKEKLAFLPNPMLPMPETKVRALTAPTIVTVGRLVEQKGLDVLLGAWAKAAPQLPDWRLAIAGGGPLEAKLKAQAATLGVATSVDFLGHVADPFPLLAGSQLFVLTSRFEGTPNALLEAMASGLPAVVSDASPGPCELVGTGDDAAGLIVGVEDIDATAEAIVRLAGDEALRRKLGSAARERAKSHDADQAIDVWLRLLDCA